jgi:Sulfotransferase family
MHRRRLVCRRAMTGPIVIIGRPRSGSRVLCRLLQTNGIFMGADLYPEFLDSVSWYQRFVVPIVTAPGFPETAFTSLPQDMSRLVRERLEDTLPRYWGAESRSQSWGWKYCETLFLVPLVKSLFPAARFIHIIRDARAVCLSNRGYFQLTQGDPPRDWAPASNGRNQPSFLDFCALVTFGKAGVRQWCGLDLGLPATLTGHRFRIQAQSWVTCVTRARAYGELLPDDYYEIRFEDLCRDPAGQAKELFRWLDLPLHRAPELVAARMHNWREARLSLRERRDFESASELAAPLLRLLDYPL